MLLVIHHCSEILLFWPDFGGKHQEFGDTDEIWICKIPGHADSSKNKKKSHNRNLAAVLSLKELRKKSLVFQISDTFFQ